MAANQQAQNGPEVKFASPPKQQSKSVVTNTTPGGKEGESAPSVSVASIKQDPGPSPHSNASASGAQSAFAKSKWIDKKIGPFAIRLNPLVSLVSILIIWGFVAAAIVLKEDLSDEMLKWKHWITRTWTWLYIGTMNIWAVFIVVIYFSKYSNLRLGREDEVPEFSDTSYFTMLFAAGVGTGMFYFAVAEPIMHYTGRNRFSILDLSDNQRAQAAMNLTFFHWGIHGWVVYVLVGLLLGFQGYRGNLPMTMRTCFYPLLGDRIFGLLGDIIDIFSVVCTMFGVCTSLGLGVIQLNAGLNRLIPQITVGSNAQLALIWGITLLATISVVSGVKAGIKRLSEICFAIGLGIMFIMFFCDDTFFILNLLTQNVGQYMGNIINLGFHTDAFAQLNNSMDGKDVPMWMDSWTVFYWGWWISWSPFVGMFIAKVSRGRTVKDFIFFTLTIPGIYTMVWFSVFGGISITMERKAASLNLTCDKLNVSVLNETTGNLSYSLVDNFQKDRIFRLSCRKTEDMLFDVVESYEGLSTFLSLLAMFSLLLYFVTSSDSGSLIIDCLTSNGDPEPPTLQRIFWSLTEGATATALLVAGGEHALRGLQSVAVCSGLFYTLVINFMCLALWRSLRIAGNDITEKTPVFVVDLVDPLCHVPSLAKMKIYLWALFAPWRPLAGMAVNVFGEGRRYGYMAVMALPFFAAIICLAVSFHIPYVASLGATFFIGFVAYASGIRSSMRDKYGIVGNMVEDFFSMLLVYPLAVIQMDEQLFYIDNTQTYHENHPNVQPPKELEVFHTAPHGGAKLGSKNMPASPKETSLGAKGAESIPLVPPPAPKEGLRKVNQLPEPMMPDNDIHAPFDH